MIAFCCVGNTFNLCFESLSQHTYVPSNTHKERERQHKKGQTKGSDERRPAEAVLHRSLGLWLALTSSNSDECSVLRVEDDVVHREHIVANTVTCETA